jgi:hypothetical protein
LELKACVAYKIFSKLSVGGGVDILANLSFPEKLQLFNINETFLVASVRQKLTWDKRRPADAAIGRD